MYIHAQSWVDSFSRFPPNATLTTIKTDVFFSRISLALWDSWWTIDRHKADMTWHDMAWMSYHHILSHTWKHLQKTTKDVTLLNSFPPHILFWKWHDLPLEAPLPWTPCGGNTTWEAAKRSPATPLEPRQLEDDDTQMVRRCEAPKIYISIYHLV